MVARFRAGAPLVSVQAEYSLLDRSGEDTVLPAAAAHGLGFLAWAPLGRGVLTGKYRHGTPADSRGASPHFTRYVGRYRTEQAARVVEAVATAAEGLGTTPLSVACALGAGPARRDVRRGRGAGPHAADRLTGRGAGRAARGDPQRPR